VGCLGACVGARRGAGEKGTGTDVKVREGCAQRKGRRRGNRTTTLNMKSDESVKRRDENMRLEGLENVG